MTVPVYITGESAEEGVEGLPGDSETIIEQHDEAAGVAFARSGVMALIGLIALRKGKAIPSWFAVLMVIASLTVSGVMAWTANMGGQIRHTEIRPDAIKPTAVSKDRD